MPRRRGNRQETAQDAGAPPQDLGPLRGSVKPENLLDVVPDALLGVDCGGVIRFVNRQSELLFGYERDDLLGAPVEMLVSESFRPVDLAQREGRVAATRSRTTSTSLKVAGRHREGTAFPVDVSLSDVGTDSGPLVIVAVRDMTPYRWADELRAVVEHSADAIIGTTADGVVTSWNPAASEMFGYAADEIIGRPVFLLSPDQGAEAEALLAQIRDGRTVEHHETIRVRKDGTALPVHLTLSPIYDAAGSVVGASATAHDMTAAGQAQRAARSMIESSLDSLVAISPEGKITDANEATVRLTGAPRDKLIGTSFSDYFTDPAKAEEIYQLVLAEGAAVDYPLTLHHRDGHEAPTEVRYNASVYRDDGGNVLGVFAAAREVTEQLRAQQEARHLAAVVEFSGESITSFSRDRLITSWNPAAERLFGYCHDEIVGTPASVMTPKDCKDEVDVVLEEVEAGRRVENFETVRIRKNGTVVPVSFSFAPVRDAGGAIIGVSAVARDLTAQKRDEATIAERHAADLDRLAELTRFNRQMVGRELKMAELKKENERLHKRLEEGGCR
jgi:PAS domain S-box-containing protein